LVSSGTRPHSDIQFQLAHVWQKDLHDYELATKWAGLAAQSCKEPAQLARVRARLSALLLITGRPRDAIAELEKMEERTQALLFLRQFLLGVAYTQTGSYDKAEVHLRKAEGLDVQHGSCAGYLLAKVLMRAGKYKDGHRQLVRTGRRHPDTKYGAKAAKLAARLSPERNLLRTTQ